jgi:hypothetical protein
MKNTFEDIFAPHIIARVANFSASKYDDSLLCKWINTQKAIAWSIIGAEQWVIRWNRITNNLDLFDTANNNSMQLCSIEAGEVLPACVFPIRVGFNTCISFSDFTERAVFYVIMAVRGIILARMPYMREMLDPPMIGARSILNDYALAVFNSTPLPREQAPKGYRYMIDSVLPCGIQWNCVPTMTDEVLAIASDTRFSVVSSVGGIFVKCTLNDRSEPLCIYASTNDRISMAVVLSQLSGMFAMHLLTMPARQKLATIMGKLLYG